MSTVIRDLWPTDINSDEVVSPEEVLQHQAVLLGQRTNGLLEGHVDRFEADDRVNLGFEVSSSTIETRMRLFEVQHRTELEYPALIVPPDDDLPTYLEAKKLVRGSKPFAAFPRELLEGTPDQWVDNPWVATSPAEFSDRIQDVLALPSVKAIVLSLLARSRQALNTNQETEDA